VRIDRRGLGTFVQGIVKGILLVNAQRILVQRWEALGTGPFLDTSERGMQLGHRGRYAHTNDHTAHLVLVRERGTLLVRQMHAMPEGIYEARTSYAAFGAFWIIHDSELRLWPPG